MTNDEARDCLETIFNDLERLRGRARLVFESLPEDGGAVDRACDLEEPWSVQQTLRDIAESLIDRGGATSDLDYTAGWLRGRLDGCNPESLAREFLDDIERSREVKAWCAAKEAKRTPAFLPELTNYLSACGSLEHDELSRRVRPMAQAVVAAYQKAGLSMPEAVDESIRLVAGIGSRSSKLQN